ncbi:MAG: pyridoxamine 5'-phosphate oxidase family protein [Bacteroidota bacterium]|nr:pyridoxamine 5'-phosphate oxidase family protein [Bacteroidota bacterium]
MEKNLEQQKALKKFKKLVEEIRTCMFITNSTSEHDHTRPMATIEVEDNGTLWFFTDIRSIKVEEVNMDKSVHLTYAHPGKESYLDVWARASVIIDKQQIKDKWSVIFKAWFPGGADDPNLGLLKLQPTECYYWDRETGKMIQFLKMAASIVSGQRLADGAEGKLIL